MNTAHAPHIPTVGARASRNGHAWRRSTKHTALLLLEALGAVAASRTLQRGRSLILTYHGILPGDDDRYDFLNHNFISAAMFDRQLRYLRQHYRPIALRDLVECYARGITPPERSLAITFDDGFANNHSVAFPLLRTHSVPFTVFVTTGLIGDPGGQLWTEKVKRAIYLHPAESVSFHVLGQAFECDLSSDQSRAAATRRVLQLLKRHPVSVRDSAVNEIEAVCGRPPLRPEERDRYAFLDWKQIREMSDAGVEFGSHTVNHPIMATLDDRSLAAEVSESKKCIETMLGKACDLLAYPNGSPADFGAREKRALQDAGYRAAFSLNGCLNSARPDLFELDRVNVGRQLDLRTFQFAATGILTTARRMRDSIMVRRRQPRASRGDA